MKRISFLTDAFKPLVDLAYPPRCPLCGDAVSDQSGLCADCFAMIDAPTHPGCASCMRPIGQTLDKSLQCYECKADPPLHSGIYAATLYGEATRKLVLTFKHGGKIALAPLLARMMSQQLPRAAEPAPLLVPVPLHRFRLWRRGFNQAALLAHELEKAGRGRLLVDGLLRPKRTPPLGGLGQKERKIALAGAIIVNPRHKGAVTGADIFLIDDVLTSGATSNACIRALLDAGARSVKIGCFARVVHPSSVD